MDKPVTYMDIWKFLRKHPEYTESSFGRLAIGDQHLVRRMKNEHRELKPGTAAKLRAFMEAA